MPDLKDFYDFKNTNNEGAGIENDEPNVFSLCGIIALLIIGLIIKEYV